MTFRITEYHIRSNYLKEDLNNMKCLHKFTFLRFSQNYKFVT